MDLRMYCKKMAYVYYFLGTNDKIGVNKPRNTI